MQNTRDGMGGSDRVQKARHFRRAAVWGLLLWCLLSAQAVAASLSGEIADPDGGAVPGVRIRLLHLSSSSLNETQTNAEGQFLFASLYAGEYRLTAECPGFAPVTRTVVLHDEDRQTAKIQFVVVVSQTETLTVRADSDDLSVVSPDPARQLFAREDLLAANPGRPGAPLSIPGYPAETASGGIKAPQYFAPGVAGDHGEPIAQFIGVGSYLVPNNLSANAHGNGYADPNIFVSQVLDNVEIDGGAFNVREGNHSINMAATYGLRSRLDPFLTVTGDSRDIDVATGISPSRDSWVAFEGSYGNGLLRRQEHRQQYKVNAERIFNLGAHRLTLFGLGYYGHSYIPGLVPIFSHNSSDPSFPNFGDTIDPRQKDQTHTTVVAANDVWQLSSNQQLQLSSFFRTYNQSLFSNFGQGLIRQSEFRTVTGDGAEYVNQITNHFTLLGGIDYNRDAPRRDNLNRYGLFDPSRPGYYGPPTAINSNNVTIGSFAPHVAVEGNAMRFFRYYLGWRRDEINFDNEDLMRPRNSFQKWVGVNSPKATLSFLPKDSWFVPLISVSAGQSFFTEDPRMGIGNTAGTPVATAHSYQLVASKLIHNTDIRLTLGHVTKSAELAKIDPDTGLQFDEGPSRLRFTMLAVRHKFSLGVLQASFSKADARDLDSGAPTPEAPRTIFDVSGTLQKLPFHMQARGEIEYVARKPLGTGCNALNPNAECVGTSIKEIRGAFVRPVLQNRLDLGFNFSIADGYTGQTTENYYGFDVQHVVGVRAASYASVSFTYHFGSSR